MIFDVLSKMAAFGMRLTLAAAARRVMVAAIHVTPMRPLHFISRPAVSMLGSACARRSPAWSPVFQNPHRTLFIQTSQTPNPNSLKFTPGKPVLGEQGSTMEFRDYKTAQASPLAQKLFQIEGVNSVFLAGDWLAVNIQDGLNWNLVKPEVFAAITDFYASGLPALKEGSDAAKGHTDTAIQDDDSEVVALIKELIETRIRPAVQEDGGDIVYRSFDEKTGKVELQLMGSCKGCPSSQVTLKSGIENMLMHYVPEVTGVAEYVDEVLETVSKDALDKLEQKLSAVQSGKSA